MSRNISFLTRDTGWLNPANRRRTPYAQNPHAGPRVLETSIVEASIPEADPQEVVASKDVAVACLSESVVLLESETGYAEELSVCIAFLPPLISDRHS